MRGLVQTSYFTLPEAELFLFYFKQTEKDQRQELRGPLCGHVWEDEANIQCEPIGTDCWIDDACVQSTNISFIEQI